MKNSNIFEQFAYCSAAATTVYVANGIMLDPNEMVHNHELSTGINIYFIHYQKASSMEELTAQWLTHIDTVSNATSSVVLVGFSAGGLVVHRIMALLEEAKLMSRSRLTSISVAPSHVGNYEPLKKFTIEFLENLTEEIGSKILRRMPWYNQNASMPFAEIIEQLKFFLSDNIYEKPLGAVDVIWIPDQDSLSFDSDTANRHSQKVMSVYGKHDIATLPFAAMINPYL